MIFSREALGQIYYFIFGAFTVVTLINVFYPPSIIYIYYHVLMAFHPSYVLTYAYSVLSVLTNALSLIPLYSYVFKPLPIFMPRLWKWLFCLRISLEIYGHSYETALLKSMHHDNLLFVASSSLFLLALIFPSYAAHFQYAFGERKV